MKFLVIGETCVDRFVYGEVKRMSPEAPVPILTPQNINENKGMSGNVVENLSFLYDDIKIVHWSQRQPITKTRYVEKKSNHMFIRFDEETIPCDRFQGINEETKKVIRESDVVLISDYDKGFLTDEDIIGISKESNLCILDSKKSLNYKTVEFIDFVKLNHSEYLNNKELCDSYPDKFIITKSEDGVVYDGNIFKSPNPQQTIDVSGAGDTFVSVFSLKYFLTKDMRESIEYSNIVCADVVNKKGVALPDKKFKL